MKLVSRLIANESVPFIPVSSGTTDLFYDRYKYYKLRGQRHIEWYGHLRGVKYVRCVTNKLCYS